MVGVNGWGTEGYDCVEKTGRDIEMILLNG
jgi:hypothetical protein